MDNKIYYGEYSLKHWIELILKKNIVLPDYQRYFVWKEKDVRTLIESFKNREFVPPVTIGALKIGTETSNLILDGQQRLTSILLAFLELFPDESEYKKTLERFADENNDEEEDDELFDDILEWKFNYLTEKGSKKEDILKKIKKGNYKDMSFHLDVDFWDTSFLGFSYLVPRASNINQNQKYYSSVFRNINVQGKPLLPQESRESLYFLNNDLKEFFKPQFSSSYSVKILSNNTKIDFVRWLSLLSQYKKDGTANYLARGYKPQMEKYYEDYIYSVVSNTNGKYGKFTDTFVDKRYNERFSKLNGFLMELDIPKLYQSIIDLDMFFMGLIYVVVFEGKMVDINKKDELKAEIYSQIADFKKDESHTKAPSNLSHLRARVTSSIKIYEKYAS